MLLSPKGRPGTGKRGRASHGREPMPPDGLCEGAFACAGGLAQAGRLPAFKPLALPGVPDWDGLAAPRRDATKYRFQLSVFAKILYFPFDGSRGRFAACAIPRRVAQGNVWSDAGALIPPKLSQWDVLYVLLGFLDLSFWAQA